MKASPNDIACMRTGGSILAGVLDMLVAHAVPGAIPLELDALAREETRTHGAKPAFLGFSGFPASVCISRNEEVVHGIPTAVPLADGDVVSFDFGVFYEGLYTDAARTTIVGHAKDDTAKRITDACKKSFFAGMKVVRAGVRVGDIGHAIQAYAESLGFSVVRSLVGHGVGRQLHEDPRIPNYGTKGTGPILFEGMTVAIEPMLTAGSYHVSTAPDGWTVVTEDGSLASHYEETIVITKSGYDILTRKQ